MNYIQTIQIIFCVLMVAVGQILFKLGAITATQQNANIGAFVNIYIVIALIIYAISTIIWIYLLRNIPLSIAYPFMSLSFILVPLASYYIFGDPLNLKMMLGGILIIIGVSMVAS